MTCRRTFSADSRSPVCGCAVSSIRSSRSPFPPPCGAPLLPARRTRTTSSTIRFSRRMSAALRRPARRSSSGASGPGTLFSRWAYVSVPTIDVTNGCGRARSNDPKSCPNPVRAMVSSVSLVMSPGTSTDRPPAAARSQWSVSRSATSSIIGW